MLIALAALLSLWQAQPVNAAIDCADSSWQIADETDLNDAIACFNVKPAGDYTMTLTQNIDLTISSTTIENSTAAVTLTIEGDSFTVDGQDTPNVRPLDILNGTITIQNITLTGGNGPASWGGAVINWGTLTINNSTLSDNLGLYGGGVFNSGTLTINNSTISGNSAEDGGGVFGNGGTVTINSSTLSENTATPASGLGGGIYTNAGTVTLNNSTLSGNRSAWNGGGIATSDAATILIQNSSIISNTADYDDTETGDGGGISAYATTVYTVTNSIIANNQDGTGSGTGGEAPDCTVIDVSGSGGIYSDGQNLIGTTTGCSFTSDVSDILNTNAIVGSLADNGGDTFTHALLAGSPAIDAGNSAEATDQRGISRPQGSADDIGAYELFDCAEQPWIVDNASDLDASIRCFNAKTLPGTYTITLSGDIDLTSNSTTIDGNTNLMIEGAGFTVDGQDSVGVRPFSIENGTVTIQNITITGGDYGTGGGIYNWSGTLTVNNSTISGNAGGFNGGGIYNNNGTVTVNNSTISGNSANDGGGIFNWSGTVTVNNSTISGNSADSGSGGGIENNSGTLNLSSSTVSDNSAVDSGGINNDSGGTVTISNSTISGNLVVGVGGGIANGGTLTISSSTISGNSADDYGGGLINWGTLTLNNSIIANSIAGGDCVNDGGTATGTYNLIENGSNACGLVNGTDNNIIGQGDPMLGPLQNNSGRTFTQALLPGSPAIDAGDSAAATDQRDVTRPQGAADDIGAFELYTCGSSPWQAASSGDLAMAIGCYNAQTSDSHTINITQDIDQNSSGTGINNTHAGVSLTIEGNGFTVDGQDIWLVRPFSIASNTTVTLQNITISGGNVKYGSGGIHNDGILTLSHSTVSGNTGGNGGGIENQGTLTVSHSTVSNNSAYNAGGIYNDNADMLTISHSTISSNAAGGNGGGIFSNATTPFTVNNSTISGNTSVFSGGGLFSRNSDEFVVSSSTISDNYSPTSGDGIHLFDGILVLQNSIFGNNDCRNNGTVVGDYNLLQGSGNSACGLTNGVDNNIVGQDPLLGSLQDNGGATFTHQLLSGSPAIDAGSSDEAADQRGVVRPQGSGDDMGAVEAVDCTIQPWLASDSLQLDLGIGCFNRQTSGTYNIAVTQDIGLPDSSLAVGNSNGGVDLIVDGQEFSVDGQGVLGERPFTIITGTVTLQNITISGGNMLAGDGGGIWNQDTLTLNNSTVISNTAEYGGGIWNSGTLTVSHNTISDNYTPRDGGGIYNQGTLTLSNSTISGNVAYPSLGPAFGGGILNSGSLTVNSSTVSDNSAKSGGDGIWNRDALTLANSIIANNDDLDCQSQSGTITDNGHNLIGSDGFACGLTHGINNNIVGQDPLLGSLQDNRGDTFTHALLTGSPAIDAGLSTQTHDQRGVLRPQGSGDDIGAYEKAVDTYELTVSPDGTGSGTVTSSPVGIDCGVDCNQSYDDGTEVMLTATPFAGSTFTGWTGDCTGMGNCTVIMNSPQAVTATFTVDMHSLTVSTDGTGGGTVSSDPAGINCGADCIELYQDGTGVLLTPTPAAGSTFAGWTGDCTGMGGCTVIMSSPQAVTATFTEESYTVFLPIVIK